MLYIFTHILDTILPPHPSVLKLRQETPERFERFYSLKKISNSTTLSDYTQDTIKAAITANKFYNHNKASILLATLVKKWIDTQSAKRIIFIPIPLSNTRIRKRGYNQVTRVVENISKDNISIQNLLMRVKDTEAQTKLDRSLRLKNISNAFVYQPLKIDVDNCHIVLIDDVITTGTTMQEAYKTLKPNLPKNCQLTCLALAH